MTPNSPAAQRGRLVSRLRPPTSIAKPAFDPDATNASTRPALGDEEEEGAYDPDKDIFDEQQAALEADAAARKKKKKRPAEDDEMVEPGNVTGTY